MYLQLRLAATAPSLSLVLLVIYYRGLQQRMPWSRRSRNSKQGAGNTSQASTTDDDTGLQLQIMSTNPMDTRDTDNGEFGSCWEPTLDQESGATYYVNKSTGETTWDEPAGR